MRFTTAIAAGAMAATAAAEGTAWLGFNSGSTFPDYSSKFKKDFEAEFKAAQALSGAPGTFNSVRLYTNIQAGSKDDPIEAFDAAIDTKTHLLLGIWASGTADINNDVSAIKKAIDKFGSKFTDLVIGVSVGSEDLYRVSVTGLKNDPKGVGAGPDTIVKFVQDFRDAFKDTALSKVPVGHVDTWDSWTNGTNKAVIDAVDWVGVDEYPYYEGTKDNNIKNSGQLFDHAFDATVAAVNGKPVWVTETGWPVTGPDWEKAQPSADNAKYFWDEVGCRRLFNKVPTFWYNLRDSNPANKPKFAITDNLNPKPYFNLTCPTHFETPDKPTTTSGSGSSSSALSTGASAPTSGSGGRPDSASNPNGSNSGSATTSGSGAKPTKDSGAASLGFSMTLGVAALLAALL